VRAIAVDRSGGGIRASQPTWHQTLAQKPSLEEEVNRRELVQAVAAQTGSEPKQVDSVLKGFTDVVTAVVAKGEPVAITGFAKFAKIERAARMGRNPATGEAIKIKASKKARITPLKAFKDAVMTPSLAPKLSKGVATGAASAPARKAAAKKAPAKTTAARKSAAPRTTAARKAPAKKSPAKRAR
jgi:DNA-binding protein HU-beta